MKWTDAQFRYRGNTRYFTQGSIRPTVAAGLVRISKPGPNDVFYDPFCGSGTIPEERALFPARKILASDYKREVIWTAEQNCEGIAIVFQSDARQTPSRSESIDCIVTNPPWNRQIAVEDLRHLYAAFLAEAKRILKPNGKLWVLTDCHEELTMAARENGLYRNAVCELSLHGLHLKVYEIRKTSP
ncbi:TRM11 family SAM-dependent methyltransferase [Paenibacillus ginsengarvi]|uniref:TRM11 family SAM-dependent methyltransferase n=1 Tax=Paenibacillus ginsengarvi TaxID=400777 RepID=UPI003B82F9D9